MSLGIFLALCIVGADLLIYFLFQWMYGEKRAAIAKKVAAQRQAMARETAKPYVVGSHKGGRTTRERVRKIRERMGERRLVERQSA